MSIGTQLRQAREAQSLSLDQVAQATHIRLHYLEALEEDHFERMPSTAQLRGFLRAYGDYLKLNSEELIRGLTQDASSPAPAPTQAPAVVANETGATSQVIFKELGDRLRSQRELMGLSLGDVERNTHIRMHYIQALERGDISHLPSPVQGRGMLSNYASFLGLDTESVLLRFADGLQADLYDRQAARNAAASTPRATDEPSKPVKPSPVRRLFSMDLFVGGFIIIFLVGFSVWGALRISRLHSGQGASPTAPPVSEILLATTGFGNAGTPALTPGTPDSTAQVVFSNTPEITGTVQVEITATAVMIASTPGLQNAPINVDIIANQRAWMRVIVDGELAFEGRVTPGSAYSFAAKDRIELTTGDAASLQVYYNQQELGQLGALGEVIQRVFTIQGIQTATPAVPFTSTPAPTSTITSTPSATAPGATSTPSPTPKP